MAADNQCEHSACSYPVGDDESYCSEHCEHAAEQDIIEISCDCGHQGCS